MFLFYRWQRHVLDQNNGGDGGGGGGGGNPPATPPPKEQPPGSSVTLTKEQFDALMARLPAAPEPNKEHGLDQKARDERERQDRENANTKQIETAMRFTLGAPDWLKTNASLLPKNIEGIFKAAEKENFSSHVEKANAIKEGIISEFFSQQSNLDLLTPGLKTTLEDFQKLTKNVKQEKAAQVFEQVFEPAFEMLKRLKKAEHLAQSGGRPSDNVESAYKEKLIKGARKHYLGEK